MTDIIPTPSDQQPMPANTSAQGAGVPANPDAREDMEARENRDNEANRPLFPSHQCTTLEKEWQAIQANFVDSPRDSVKQADALVTKTIDILSSSFGEMRGSMERTWEKDGDVSTEELRLAMQNYRSFFHRLLSI
jgi:hypothetical protein